MKIEKARKNAIDFIEYYDKRHEFISDLFGDTIKDIRDSFEVLLTATDKEVGIKPKRQSIVGNRYLCRKCHGVVNYNANYCHSCGNRLDWDVD